MNKLKLKIDISIYNHIKGMAPPSRTDFFQMELWMELKQTAGVAFKDPLDSEESHQLSIDE